LSPETRNAPDARRAGGSAERVVAVLPAYNLEAGIGDIVARTLPFVDAVVVTADGSRDGTAAAARAAGADAPEPEAVRGKGFAVKKGIRRARELGGTLVILMDSDGQHLPEEIPGVVAPLLEGRSDMVVGSRMLGTLRTSRINVFGNWVLKILSFLVTGRWMTDTESGFRAFRGERLYAIEPELESKGYEIESELLLRALHHGLSVVEVPITVPFAVPGVTVWDGVKVAWFKLRLGLALAFTRRSPAARPGTTDGSARSASDRAS
jgi:glycosyltransferase involved in cell wall biosynthesis